ncbi:MAG: hypothetical protein IPL78_31275 [Chloroflexi bacterium]|nr:hypothetical protein [Chloroflexota bacterium]
MKTVVGLYDDLTNAHDTVNDLVSGGFDRSDISLIAGDPDNTYSKNLGTNTVNTGTDAAAAQATENAMAGAFAGGAIGGLAGMLVGLGALAIPGLGPVIAAGPIVAGLTGAGIGAAAGGLLGALIGWGIPEEHAAYYAEGIRRGSTLVALKVDEGRVEDAVAIMDRHEPVNVERRSEFWRSSGWTGYDPNASAYSSSQIASERESYNTYDDHDYDYYAPSFRSHYDSSLLNSGRDYNWYEPGYRYGYGLARNQRYRDYSTWDEIEAEARGGWERTEDATQGTWEDFKASIRHAWEEVKDAFDGDDDYDMTERDTTTSDYTYTGGSSARGVGSTSRTGSTTGAGSTTWRGAQVHDHSGDTNGGSTGWSYTAILTVDYTRRSALPLTL